MTVPLREAASVILLRRKKTAGFEVFLLRRKRAASFMGGAFVFPGGGTDPEEDARTCAARELFEEAGVLLAKQADAPLHQEPNVTLGDGAAFSIAGLRKQVLAGANATTLLAEHQMQWWTDVLAPWSHWITPSIEPKRFSARFYVCEMPAGQRPSFDGDETIEQVWVSPDDAIVRAGELSLPPPQLRTMHELVEHATIEAVMAASKARADEPHPILPRRRALLEGESGITLLLPWDREYTEAGIGDSAPLTYAPAWARGPSRFVLEDRAWKHITAPGSTTAG